MVQIKLTRRNYDEIRKISTYSLYEYIIRTCKSYYKYYEEHSTVAYKIDKEFVTYILYPAFIAYDVKIKYKKYFEELKKDGYEIY